VDILRCQVSNGQEIYRDLDRLLREKEGITVEIIRKNRYSLTHLTIYLLTHLTIYSLTHLTIYSLTQGERDVIN
jgi:hypothetical protein